MPHPDNKLYGLIGDAYDYRVVGEDRRLAELDKQRQAEIDEQHRQIQKASEDMDRSQQQEQKRLKREAKTGDRFQVYPGELAAWVRLK